MQRLHQQGATLCFVTSDSPVDHELLTSQVNALPWSEIVIEPLPVRPLAGLQDYLRLGVAWQRAEQLIRRFRPTVAVGFGSAVSGPTLLAAKWHGVPVLIHEQNVVPGQANRWLAPFANTIALSFGDTRRHWQVPAGKDRRVVVTGNPLRFSADQPSRAESLKRFDLAEDRTTLLVMGGSQGASTINRIVPATLARLDAATRERLQVIHLAGLTDARHVQEQYAALPIRHQTYAFWDEMAHAYTAADLVIGRAGATSLAELAHFGCPAILVPYPFGRGHQRLNATLAVHAGAAILMDQVELTPERLHQTLQGLLADRARLARMGQAMSRLAVYGAAQQLAEEIVTLARGKKPS